MIIDFPNIDPIAFSIWFLDVRWYGLSYAFGFFAVYQGSVWLAQKQSSSLKVAYFQDTLTACIIIIVIGGRLGFVLFYEPAYYLANPLEIFAVWKGGMAFHGAFIGIFTAGILYAKYKKFSFLMMTDTTTVFVPIAIAFGRAANFVNGEHWGRPTFADFGMIFPWVDQQPRHPSQLYEVFAEGILLFIFLFSVTLLTKSRLYIGFQTGLFIAGYGIARTFIEFFRTPDWYVPITSNIFISSGQVLSLPMIIIGFALCFYAYRYNRVTAL